MKRNENLEKLFTDQDDETKDLIRFSAKRAEELFKRVGYDLEKALDIAVKEFQIIVSTVTEMGVDKEDFKPFITELMQAVTERLLESPFNPSEEMKKFRKGHFKRKDQQK